MILYLPVKQRLFHPDIGEYTSYGMAALRLFHSQKQVAFVGDVDTSAYKVLHLTICCTLCQLDPIHPMDVVEDFLCS